MDPPGVGLETFPAEVLEELPAVAVAPGFVELHELAPAVGVGLETEPAEEIGSKGALALADAAWAAEAVDAGAGAVLFATAVGKLPVMAWVSI